MSLTICDAPVVRACTNCLTMTFMVQKFNSICKGYTANFHAGQSWD